MQVVVVESPAKAKTINKYLGKDFTVLASYGHVRDLPPKDGSVDPDDDFAMKWEVQANADKRLKDIATALKTADSLVLATDPDREGEAISWHVEEEMRRRRVLKDKPVRRVVFNEITKRAVLEAFNNPRDVDVALVQAYLARRALDYLVGFNLSPVLWRKLPGSRSAGRVQSVALRLICEREAKIEVFKAQAYWSFAAHLDAKGSPFTARLTQIDGKKLQKMSVGTKARADAIMAQLAAGSSYHVTTIEKKQVARHPAAPFTTSTLQQEAARKLGFANAHTMSVAQKLYEGIAIEGETVGLITYMRTDGLQLSAEAIGQTRSHIKQAYGAAYVPDKARVYKSKAKNAQEAHEAIRPTDPARTPESLRPLLTLDQLKLYTLIWRRMLACQMASARFDQVTADIGLRETDALFRATGRTMAFDGFIKVYSESHDDAQEEEAQEGGEQALPPLEVGQVVNLQKLEAKESFTQPPPRYTEASLVKAMEELGIGRPSTYASIIQVLQDRDYVTLDKKRFVPAERGRIVTAFLANFFEKYVGYGFTASLEEQLDDVSGGRGDWKALLSTFWQDFTTALEGTKALTITEVIDTLDRQLGPHFFPVQEAQDAQEPQDLRKCPGCGDGRLGLKLGKTGGFIGCSNYPTCRVTTELRVLDPKSHSELTTSEGKDSLGIDPAAGLEVFLKKGPYGWYVQLGQPQDYEDKQKPKRASLPKGTAASDMDLATALNLLALPRELGDYEGDRVTAGLGRYGPYVKLGTTYASLSKDDDVLTVGLNRAVDLIVAQREKRSGGTATGIEIGKHPKDGKPITRHAGRYGPYVKHGRINATIPKGQDPETLTLEATVALITAQATKKKAKKKA